MFIYIYAKKALIIVINSILDLYSATLRIHYQSQVWQIINMCARVNEIVEHSSQ